jgi:hypothetical protein
MKRVSLTCSIIFALAAIVLGTAAGTARAAVILLDVSGSILSHLGAGGQRGILWRPNLLTDAICARRLHHNQQQYERGPFGGCARRRVD